MSRLLAPAAVTGALLATASPAGASVDDNIIAVLIGVKPVAGEHPGH